MAKIAYLQCPTGIAGDMCLGAIVDTGVPLDYLNNQLQRLGIASEYNLREQKVHRQTQIATKVHVDLTTPHHHHHHHHAARHLPEIEALIEKANLPSQAATWSLQVFRQLAIAEGAVHGVTPEEVHFHEVGATDAIVDIVGTCLGLDWLGIESLYCSPLPTGGGTVKVAHGILPVPVPAVMQLWQTRHVPIYSNGINKELVTPTGAALAVTLATDFGSPPAMKLETIGLGAGSQDLAIPNILRLWVGSPVDPQTKSVPEKKSHTPPSTNYPLEEEIAVLETQIDDLSPQAIGYAFEALFAAGAVDVFTQGIGMKKSRPGILLTVICPPEKIAPCEAVIFQETTTLGIRHRKQHRSALQRQIEQVETIYGTVRLKIAYQGSSIINVQPEYEDCAQLAREHQKPWYLVQQTALSTWQKQQPSQTPKS